MELEEIKKLAILARLDIGEGELESLSHEFDAILSYIGQIKEVEVGSKKPSHFLQNIMREDIATTERGEYTDKILAEMPDTEDGYLKVKSIL